MHNQPAMSTRKWSAAIGHWSARAGHWCASTVASLALVIFGVGLTAQSTPTEAHLAAAKAAAGTDFAGVFNRICNEAVPQTAPPVSRGGRGTVAQRPPGPPPRETWHAEPVKVFDNLYFLGQTEYSVWAVNTSAGIILIDSIFDYSVDDEVVGGLKKLGLDPAAIKYVIVSHGHADHSGGAKYLQDKFDAHVILAAADWDLLDRSAGARPRRDMVATDGDNLCHARAYPRDVVDGVSSQGPWDGARRGLMGWHRVQLDAEPDRLHHARSARTLLVRDLQRVRPPLQGDHR